MRTSFVGFSVRGGYSLEMDDDRATAAPPRIDGAVVHLDWQQAAVSVREATFSRLSSLVLEKEPKSVVVDARPTALRSVDDELAALVYDSVIDDDLLVGVRSAAQAVRQLTFEARDLLLELEVSGARTLVGQVVPPQVAVVELRHRGGSTSVETDELGCFRLSAMPDGPVSLRCRPTQSGAGPIATSWITL